MKTSVASIIAAILALLLGGTTEAGSRVLKPAGRIGVGWTVGEGWMSFVAFSSDGKMVASDGPATPADISGDLTLWTFPAGRFVRRLKARPSALSPDWKYYASDHDVRRVSDDVPIASTGQKGFAAYAFSPDDRHVAVALPDRSRNGDAIRIVDLASGRVTGRFGFAHPFSIAFSPDGHTLAVGYWDEVVLWNVVSHRRIATFRGFKRYVGSLSFSADRKLLAGGTDLGTLQIWDVRREVRLHAVDIGAGGDVSQPAFNSDGSLVAVGVYGTGEAWLVNVGSGKVLDHRKVSDLGCGGVAFSPDGRYLIAPSTGGLTTWPYDEGGTIRVFEVGNRRFRGRFIGRRGK